MSSELSSFFPHFKIEMENGRNHRVFEFDRFRLDPDNLLLYRGDEELQLPPKIVKTLSVLVQRPGEVVSKDELLESVWSDSIVNESSLTQHLYVLRKVMGDRPEGGPYIETLRRRGYRFVGDVIAYEKPQPKIPETRQVAVNESRVSGNVLRLADWTGSHQAKAMPERPTGPVSDQDTVSGTAQRSSRVPRVTVGVAFLIGLAVLAAAGIVLFGAYRFSGRSQTSHARSASDPYGQASITRLTTSGRTKRSAISPDGTYAAHVTDDPEGQSLWVRHVAAPTDVRIAGPEETEYVSVTFSPDGGNVYYAKLDRDIGDVTLFKVPVLGGPSTVVATDIGPIGFSPDGSRIAYLVSYSREESRLFVANADGSDEQTVASLRLPDYFRGIWNAPAWSADGKIIYAPVRKNDEKGPYETVIGFGVEDHSEHPLGASRWQLVGQPRSVPGGLLLTASEKASDPIQVWYVSTINGIATRVTNDLNNYSDLSVTADGNTAAVMQAEALSSVWIAPGSDTTQAKQIGSEVGSINDVAWAPDGKIFYRPSGTSEISSMSADGQGSKQLTDGAFAGRGLDVAPDGDHIVLSSNRTGKFHIWLMKSDGSDARQLTSGNGEFYPEFSNDGRWIVYQSGDEIDPTVWKVPFDGGEPVLLSDTKALRPAISPDGNHVAFHYLDPEPKGSKWRIGIVPMDGTKKLRWFDFPSTVTLKNVRWSPDGRSIVYSNENGGLSDLWAQPLDGGSPRKVTDLRSDQIMTFDWSRGGQWLAYVRNVETSNVVLMKFRERQE